MYLYFNNLRELPNYGCRTTGNALEKLLNARNNIARFDAMESVNNCGWDAYARGPLKHNGIVPHSIYDYAWTWRKTLPSLFKIISKIDKFSGGEHDYISKNPKQSILNYRRFSRTTPRLNSLEAQMEESDGIIINGEGTLIFGNPTLRDALYILFIMALAIEKNKPVFLLNAMISPCPYNGEDKELVDYATTILKQCKVIAVREASSFNYIATKIGKNNLEIIPDALFTWGQDIRNAASLVKKDPRICESFPPKEDFLFTSLDSPYICISGSSSAWRYKNIQTQFEKLVNEVKKLGHPVFLVETCDGDFFTETTAKACGVKFIAKSTPAMAAAGILSNALVYITGRYHPSIMASASGTPCVFLTSNSHKTSSIQNLLGYEQVREYPVCPSDSEIKEIINHTAYLIKNRSELSKKIRANFDDRAKEASRYIDILTNERI